jgi:rubrerythrin
MDEAELMDLLEEAMDAGEATRRLYLQAERLAETKQLKRLFRLLAAEQSRHQRLLAEAYRSVRREHGRRLLQSERAPDDSAPAPGGPGDHQTEP